VSGVRGLEQLLDSRDKAHRKLTIIKGCVYSNLLLHLQPPWSVQPTISPPTCLRTALADRTDDALLRPVLSRLIYHYKRSIPS